MTIRQQCDDDDTRWFKDCRARIIVGRGRIRRLTESVIYAFRSITVLNMSGFSVFLRSRCPLNGQNRQKLSISGKQRLHVNRTPLRIGNTYRWCIKRINQLHDAVFNYTTQQKKLDSLAIFIWVTHNLSISCNIN